MPTNDNDTLTPDETPEPALAPTPDPVLTPELTGDALRISQIETEVTAIDAQIQAAETGRQRKELTARRDALTQEKSLLQLRPVLEAPERESEPSEPADIADIIAPVDGLSEKYQDAADGYGADMAGIASDMGMPAAEAEVLYHFAVGRAVEDAERDAHAALAPGQLPGPDLANRRECETRIMRRYGPTAGAALISGAQAAFQKLPPDIKTWLDHDSGDGRLLTNSPAVIAALALWGGGYGKLTKDAAAKELAQLRASKGYLSRDALTLDKAHLLSLIVARGAAKHDTVSLKAPKPKAAPASVTAKIDTEIRATRLDPAYASASHPNHRQVVNRMAELMAQRHPERD